MRWLPFLLSLLPAIGFASSQVYVAQRVISLSPHATELAYAAGLGEAMIAASDYSDYPEAAKKLERVANYRGIKLERIIALKPDLILAWKGGNPPREMAKLEQLGIKVYYSNPVELEDIATAIEDLGQWSAKPEAARQSAQDFRHHLKQLKEKYQDQRKVSFFYQLSSTPLITVANKNWPSPVFSLCGGKNIFATSPSPYPQVNQEQVLVRQPEVIFTSYHADSDGQLWQKWQNELPAVARKQIWLLEADWINRPTPRSLKAVRQVCDFLDQARQYQSSKALRL